MRDEGNIGKMEGTDKTEERHFGFGANWRKFLQSVDENRIASAEQSLREMLQTRTLAGRRFLDIGSGSGLFSLAARRMGAVVHSFDYDPDSVNCTLALKLRYFKDDPGWKAEQGSVLDENYLKRLGTFDIVYSWGVLHHTGAMWKAFENIIPLVKKDGDLFIAIYNDQGWASRCWRAVKRIYNVLPGPARWLVLVPAFGRIWGPTLLRDAARGRPLHTWRNYSGSRGMSPWRDVVDWVGGYPFETAKPETVTEFFCSRGFALRLMKTAGGGYGCNDFVFRRTTGDA